MTETEYTTIRVSKEAWAEAKEKKGEGQTWNEYITDERRGMVDVEDFDRIAELVERIPERTANELEGRLR